MVKGVVGEEERLSLVEERLAASGKAVEVGLIIGKLSSELDRGFIFDLVATPLTDDGQPPCSLLNNNDDKSKKKKNNNPINSSTCSLAFDMDWVFEHARQVSRMMVGGIKVIGVYLWAPEAAFKNSTLPLSQTVKGVADATPHSKNYPDERLLLHICYSPRRWTCRNWTLASNITSSSLRPCDFKMGRLFDSLQVFRCIYKFDMRLPVFSENFPDFRTLNNILQDGISIHTKELKDALAVVDGILVNVDEDMPCASNKLHEVELLLPIMKDGSLDESSPKEVVGMLVCCGSVCSYSYLTSKEPVSHAVADIKEDITTSLISRLDIISDEAERETAAASRDVSEANFEMSDAKFVYQIILKPLRKEIILPFPRRVFVPWLADTYVCDYLLPSETFEGVQNHFVELLSMKISADTSLMEPETELGNLGARSFWDVSVPFYQEANVAIFESKSRSADSKDGANKLSRTGNFKGMFAGFILLIAIIVGLLFYAQNSSEL